jgi:hypothetical protein
LPKSIIFLQSIFGASRLTSSVSPSWRFADHFKITLGRHPTQFIGGEQIEGTACEHRRDFSNGSQNVPQPIFHGGRHSEHLDQIVGNSLSDTRL